VAEIPPFKATPRGLVVAPLDHVCVRVCRRLRGDELNSKQLMATGRDRVGLDRGLRWRLLAPLLVLTLLACHGVFGALHQTMPTSAPVEGQASHAGAIAGQTGGASDEPPLDGASYAATLFFVLAAVFWLLFGGNLAQAGARITRPALVSHQPPTTNYPRGPTLPLLQTLRL
jgi:hypothetical protein